jgi:hypothetical protein
MAQCGFDGDEMASTGLRIGEFTVRFRMVRKTLNKLNANDSFFAPMALAA